MAHKLPIEGVLDLHAAPMAPLPMAWVVHLTLVVLLCAATPDAGQPQLPALIVEAPESLSGLARRVQNFDRSRLAGIMTLTGLRTAGAPIRVILLAADSNKAEDTPPWVAGFADPTRNLIVLFPERIGSYPYDSLEEVLHHEVAHVLTSRAAGGGRIPRWFDEGLASAAESNWGLDDRSRFTWETVVGGRVTIAELEGLFKEGRREVARAYILADAIVRDLLARHGSDFAAGVLARMARGEPFEQALYRVTGSTSNGTVNLFWTRHSTWERWIAVFGRPFTLWSVMTLLALIAIWTHRRRRAEKWRQWEAEEQAEEQAWEEHRRRYRIH